MRKPVVFASDGGFEELPSDEALDASTSGKDVAILANANASAITICQVVYKTATSNQVDLARANASGTKGAIGLVAVASIAPGSTGAVQMDGIMAAATEDWDAVTGQSGGLTPGAVYFESTGTAGGMQATVPGAGFYLMRLGTALSATEFDIDIDYVGKKA